MTKALSLSFVISLIFMASCNTPESIQKDAESLCNCFQLIHAVDPEDEEAVANMNAQMEECNKMWKEIFDKYKDDAENKRVFNQAYNTCQDEK
jgi:hypothetical protein